MEATPDGASFVTARGWDDLSAMIKLYEAQGLTVDELLVEQYVQNGEIAKRFAMYYDLFNEVPQRLSDRSYLGWQRRCRPGRAGRGGALRRARGRHGAYRGRHGELLARGGYGRESSGVRS